MGDRSPLPTPILQGQQQRGAQHQIIMSLQELLTLEFVFMAFSSYISFQPTVTPGWLPMFYG